MCHQNANRLSRLPTIAHLIPEADRLFSYISDKSGLDLESCKIQDVVKRLSLDTVLDNGILYKIINKQKCIFVCPSKRTNTIMNAHKLIGHGGTRKTLKQLSLNSLWDLCLLMFIKLLWCAPHARNRNCLIIEYPINLLSLITHGILYLWTLLVLLI